MSKILQNAVRTIPNDKIFVSEHGHDFVTFKVNNEEHFIDGGRHYLRGSVISNPETQNLVENLFLAENSPIQEIRMKLLWGTFGVKGNRPLKWKFVRNLSKRHLKAIIDTQPHVSGLIRDEVFKYWLEKKQNS